MDKLKLHTPDFTEANIAKLAELFPNCATESQDAQGQLKRAIDFDLLKQELASSIVEGPQERYQLNWPGKREALLTANAPIAKTLRPCIEESVDFETTQNLFIEGDNLDALKLLQETYLNKVKMIYIDPPYNTGNDFIYEDDFAEDSESYLLRSNQKDEVGNRLVANNESNGRFHSDWLSMLYPRLKLARNLLSDDGAIFISIDDNEIHNLRRILDEIFGEQNFVASVAVVTNMKGRNDKKHIANCHEHILIYGKSNFISYGLPLTEEQRAIFKYEDDKGNKYSLRDLRKRGGPDNRSDRPNMFFSIFWNEQNKTCSLERKSPDDIEIFPIKGDGSEGRWRWGKPKVQSHLGWLHPKNNLKTGRWDLEHRVYLDPGIKIGDSEPDEGEDDDEDGICERTSKPKSIWLGGEFSSDRGKRALKELLPGDSFDFPKSVDLVKQCLQIGTSKDGIYMDFFSGSCTTANAGFSLNSEDGGKRKFILIQLPELCDEKSGAFKEGYKTIAEIGKERIRRAGQKIKQDNADKSGIDQLDIGFRVLKVDSSNMNDIYYTPDALKHGDLFDFVDNVREDRSEEDLLFQVLLDWGVDLSLPITSENIAGLSVLFVDGNALAACFDKDGGITEDFVKQLAARQPLRVVFRDAGFANDSVKINIEQIFKLLSPSTEIKTL